jgi:hypothetical protein
MSKASTTLVAVALVWLVSACADEPEPPRTPTPYQPKRGAYGFTDVSLGPNRYLVTFRGNAYTLPEDVQAMAHQRASEVCPGGYKVLGERDLSVEVDGDDSTRCVRIYGVTRCTSHHGESHTKPRWQLKVACKADEPSSAAEPAP